MLARLALVAVVVACAACSTFGSTLPPGAAGGSFLDEPKGAVPFGGDALDDQHMLVASTRAHVDANIDVLMVLRGSSSELRENVVTGEKEIHARVEETNGVN